MKHTLTVTVAGVQMCVTCNYEPAAGGLEYNDPETLDLQDAEIITGSLLDLLGAYRTTIAVEDAIKEELRKQIS